MYKLTPEKVYVMNAVADDPLCVRRMERMLDAIDVNRNDVVPVTTDNVAQIAAELHVLWKRLPPKPGTILQYRRPIVFNRLLIDGDKPDYDTIMQQCPEDVPMDLLHRMYGDFDMIVDQHPHERDQKLNMVCWPTYNLGTVSGCPHGCQYCADGKNGSHIAIGLNIEEYMQKILEPAIERHPWNKVFRMILNITDLIAFEPEYGLFDLFTQTLAKYEGRYGHFHTAGSNVAWMKDLKHHDRLIGVWSITCDSVARKIEPASSSMIDRFEAARLCQEMGIPVRFKFKPIIPIKNWREEYAHAISELFKRVKPESIGFCMVIWCDIDQLLEDIPEELLDADYVREAREAAESLKGIQTRPFPHHVRREVYRFFIQAVRRHNQTVPLYISTESREMWDDLTDELGQNPRAYVCGCSSVAVPGGKLALSDSLRYSTYSPHPA